MNGVAKTFWGACAWVFTGLSAVALFGSTTLSGWARECNKRAGR